MTFTETSTWRDPRQLLTSLGVVVYDWDISTDSLTWGPNAADLLGFDPAASWPSGAAFEQSVLSLDGETRADTVAATQHGADDAGLAYACFYRLQLPDGTPALVDDTGRSFADGSGRVVRAHGTLRVRRDGESGNLDVGEGRSAFLAQVGRDITECRDTGRALTLFALAVANLGELNDAVGFDAVDLVIDTLTVRLGAVMRRRDRFVRYAGNRFALALRGCNPAEAEIAAARLMRLATTEPVGTPRGAMPVRFVIGAASAPEHAVEAGLLLRRAEACLSLAKRREGRPFVIYDPKLFRQASRTGRDPLLDGVDILNGRRIVLALQPVVAAASRGLAFSESLLRVESRDGSIRPAGDVVPALERAGLIHLADIRMLELVSDYLHRHPAERVSLNVSPVTMERSDWLPALKAHFGTRLDVASRLIVEVTETTAIREQKVMRSLLDATRCLGAAVAIDDFGAGYTSFRNLRSFPVDFLKIDGAFVQNIARSVDDRFFVRTLIQLAQHLGIPTVAEWVEDEESAVLLTEWGADYLQGDHCGAPRLAKPVSAPVSLVA